MTTTHVYRDYLFHVRYAPADSAYLVDLPDVPDVITSGGTLPRAFANACEALDLHLETLQKLGLSAPTPKCRLVIETIG